MNLPEISKYARAYFAVTATLILVVIATAAIIDLSRSTVPAAFGGNAVLENCAKRLGAGVLFWLMLFVEIVCLAKLTLFPFSTSAVEAYRAILVAGLADSKFRNDQRFEQKLKIVTVCFVVFSYGMSFAMAFGSSLCLEKSTAEGIRDYVYLLGVFGSRALSFYMACHLFLPSFSKQQPPNESA